MVTRRPASTDRTTCRHVLPMGVGPFAFRYQGNWATPTIYWYHSKGNWLRYNLAAYSFIQWNFAADFLSFIVKIVWKSTNL